MKKVILLFAMGIMVVLNSSHKTYQIDYIESQTPENYACQTPYIPYNGVNINFDGSITISVTGSVAESYDFYVYGQSGSLSYHEQVSVPYITIPPQGWFNGEPLSIFVYITKIYDCVDHNGRHQNGSSTSGIIYDYY